MLTTGRKSWLLQFLAIGLVAVLWSCGGSEKQEVIEADPNGLVKLVVNSSDEMRYDQRSFRVKAGAKIELTLNHTGKMGKRLMGHNLVILKPGTDLNDFASRALQAEESDYIPEGDEMIGHTRLIGGGESDTIIFDVLEKGRYPFICTFPGHYSMMRGAITVE